MDSLSKIAHRRLYPALTDSSYLPLRSRRLIFGAWARQLRNQRLTVLDVGGKYHPYRPLFGDAVERYVAVDLVKTEFVSVIADGQRLPFKPEVFDVAIATQVFEYIDDPREAVRQIHAALKPGGVLLASFAACAPKFGDDERWRFMATGLRSILMPFAKVEIIPEVYSVGGLIRTVNAGLESLTSFESVRKAYGLSVCPLLNLLGLGLEKMKLTSNDRFTTNFSVRAKK